MNKYQKLIQLIKKNNFSIISQKVHDSQSGWNGESLVIKDGAVPIFDLSVNGYCFDDNSVDKALDAVEDYLENKNMTSFDAFKKWVDAHKE
jgi:hypothetical protein